MKDNELFFTIMHFQNTIEKNNRIRLGMKAIAGIALAFAVMCNLAPGKDLIVGWLISIIAIIATFLIDSHCVKKNKAYELTIYQMEVDELRIKKETAKITKVPLSDSVMNRKIKKPEEKATLPIMYYMVLLILGIIISVVMLL